MKAKRPGRPEGKLCHPHSQELQRQPQSMLFSIVLCQNNPQNSPGMKQPTLCFSSNPGLELLLTNKTVSFDGSFLQSGLICWRLVSPAPKPLSTGQVPLSVWDLLQPGTTWTRMKQQLVPSQVPVLVGSQFGETEKKHLLSKKLLWNRETGGDLPSCVSHKQEHHEEQSLLGNKRV